MTFERLMSRLLFALAIAAGAFAGLAPASAAEILASDVAVTRTSSAVQRVRLGLDKSIVIELPADAYDILVANPEVVDAVTRTSRRIYLFGKRVGETNIFVFGANGEQITSLDLYVERDVAGLEDYLARFLPESQIQVELINDNVVLTGEVATPLDAKRAEQLANIFVTGGEATTGTFEGGGNGLTARQSSSIVNMLQIVGQDQVMLKVSVVEIKRSLTKQLGFTFGATNSYGTYGGGFDRAGGSGAGLTYGMRSGNGVGQAIMGASLGSLDFTATLDALEQNGMARILAEPVLTAVSGGEANFDVGGDVNVVTSGDDSDSASASYQYGIQLSFSPVVLSAGRIAMEVSTSVSEPQPATPLVSVGQNSTVFATTERSATTSIELPSGGSMMIAGLVRDSLRQNVNGLPGLANIPVLGALFRSREFVREETELVIVVTPYLAKPTAPEELQRPDRNFAAPSDAAGILLGHVNRLYGVATKQEPVGQFHGTIGYIYK